VYLPGFFSIPPVDRDESRFAQASRQMFESVALPIDQRDVRPIERDEAGRLTGGLHSGRLVVPMLVDRPRLNKPPLIYWLQAGSAAICTGGDPGKDAIWMYRVPSLIAAIITVLATWRIGLTMFDPRTGWLAAALLAVCPVVVWEAHQARADMVMLACTTIAVWGLWTLWKQMGVSAPNPDSRLPNPAPRPWLIPTGMWIAVGAGVLTKGPITPMIVASAALALGIVAPRRGGWRWLWNTRPVLGLLIVTVMVGPWVWAVSGRVGIETYWATIWDEVFRRGVTAKEGHWGPPGYHLVLMVVLFWPGSMLTGWSFVRAWKHASSLRTRDSGLKTQDSRLKTQDPRLIPSPEFFLLCWLVPGWLVFELSSTKLPHYTMPLYPALALLSARGVITAAGLARVPAIVRVGHVGWGLLGLVLATGPIMAATVLGAGHSTMIVAAIASALCLALAMLSVTALLRDRPNRAQTLGIAQAVVLFAVSLQAVLPACDRIWLTRAIGKALAQVDSNTPIAAIGYHEDSLIFATRGRAQRIEPRQERAWIEKHPAGILVKQINPDDADEPPAGVDLVTGLNYSTGDEITIAIIPVQTLQGNEP
jgi:4-amino-4-deoxy-L-arabinose transferase-like glycosyltransferase